MIHRARQRDDSGSSTTTVVLLTPVFLILIAFAVFVGRVAAARQDVVSASRDAARAASIRQAPGPATADATSVAEATLQSRGVTCAPLSIDIDVTNLQPGGSVSATVSCTVSADDILGFWTPGSKVISETSTAFVDAYRAGGT